MLVTKEPGRVQKGLRVRAKVRQSRIVFCQGRQSSQELQIGSLPSCMLQTEWRVRRREIVCVWGMNALNEGGLAEVEEAFLRPCACG